MLGSLFNFYKPSSSDLFTTLQMFCVTSGWVKKVMKFAKCVFHRTVFSRRHERVLLLCIAPWLKMVLANRWLIWYNNNPIVLLSGKHYLLPAALTGKPLIRKTLENILLTFREKPNFYVDKMDNTVKFKLLLVSEWRFHPYVCCCASPPFRLSVAPLCSIV